MSGDYRFERWLNRNGRSDAYQRWRAADPARASDLAFVAIASDERILLRLDAGVANNLAIQAEAVAGAIPSIKDVSELSIAAARVVAARIQEWRRHAADPSRRRRDDVQEPGREGIRQTADVAAGPQEILRQAEADFPNARLSAGRTLMDTALRIGARGLLQLGEPMDRVVALGAARAAARRVRGHARSMELPLARCAEAIGILQEWCGLSGKNPFLVPYGTEGGNINDRVAGFALDAGTCVEVAAETPGAIAAPGFDALEVAEEFHAYGVLSINPDLVWNMNIDKAQSYASAAARLAAAVIADPLVRIPEFPAGCEVGGPKLVLALAGVACQSGFKLRRSAGTRGR